jgi:hypothetical protein
MPALVYYFTRKIQPPGPDSISRPIRSNHCKFTIGPGLTSKIFLPVIYWYLHKGVGEQGDVFEKIAQNVAQHFLLK